MYKLSTHVSLEVEYNTSYKVAWFFLITSKKLPLHLKEKFYVTLKSFIFTHLSQEIGISQNIIFSAFCIIFWCTT